MGNSTPVNRTPKTSSRNLTYVIMSARLPAMQILVSIGTVGGFSPNRRNVTTLCLFFDCPVLSLPFSSRSCVQVEPLDRFSRFMAQTTCFRARMVLLGDHMSESMSPNPPNMGVNRQLQAKTAKYENRNISNTINRINTKVENQAETNDSTSWMV